MVVLFIVNSNSHEAFGQGLGLNTEDKLKWSETRLLQV